MIPFLRRCTDAEEKNANSCKKTVSASADEPSILHTEGTAYQFRVNYKKAKDLGNGRSITSPPFKSGGYKWIIRCYPSGTGNDKDSENIGVFLELLSDYKNLHVNFTLAIMEKMESYPLQRKFDGKFSAQSKCGSHHFVQRNILENYYLTENGYFQILCFIKVAGVDNDGVPPIPIGSVKEDIATLWDSGEMTDVNFNVEGEIISAHKVILAVRSRVFKAELFGHMTEATSECITVEDMQPAVFRALLHYMYDNSLDNEGDTDWETSVMTQHLLAAADRYAVDGLIAKCKKYLMLNLSLDTVMDVLMFSEQHCFLELKDACLEFASKEGNFTKVAFTEGYIEMAQAYPSLWAELREKVTKTKSTDTKRRQQNSTSKSILYM